MNAYRPALNFNTPPRNFTSGPVILQSEPLIFDFHRLIIDSLLVHIEVGRDNITFHRLIIDSLPVNIEVDRDNITTHRPTFDTGRPVEVCSRPAKRHIRPVGSDNRLNIADAGLVSAAQGLPGHGSADITRVDGANVGNVQMLGRRSAAFPY